MGAERRGITIDVGEFTRLALEQRGGDTSRLVREAAVYYLSDSGSNRPARSQPGFPDAADHQVPIELTLAESQWRDLEEEADEQGITLERLLEHALLYYLADLDSGQVARRLVGEEGDSA
jgi:hypothetical protein